MTVKKHLIPILSLFLGLISLTAAAAEYAIRGTTDKDVAIYAPGEKMVFTLRVVDGDTSVPGMTLRWTRTGDDGKTEKGEGVADANGLTITTTMDKPGFVRIEAKAYGQDGKNLQGFVGGWGANKEGSIFFDGGACVQPEKLQPVQEPDDFDTFWQSMKGKLDAVPIKADVKEIAGANPKVKLFAVTVACAGPKAVTGYLTIPMNATAKSLPAIVSFHGYGTGKHGPPGWFNEWAIVFDINAHGMELGRDDAYYKQVQKELANYCFKKDENDDREKTYYYGMSLRVMRALQYVKTLPEWNGKELQSNGGSQGGLQGLWGAGLDPDVTSSDIWSPWCCDLGGITQGRIRGWRPDYTTTLNYYDPVFHARRIKAKVHIVVNYGDYTCPPSGVWTVYNGIPGSNKSMEVKQGCTHGYEMKPCMRYVISPAGIKAVGVKK